MRLELARAFFLAGDYDNAIIQFQRARAGDVPDTVKTNIDQYLAALSRGKEWSFRFSAALAPDTNENAATTLDQINLYGLPFTLNSQAREKSGVGAFGDLFGAQEISYVDNPSEGGQLYSSQITANYTLSPSSAVQILFGINRQNAGPAYSYTNYWIGAGYQQDLRFGFSTNFRPSYFITPYDAALPGFGPARSDHLLLLQLDVLNRRLDYGGFTPKFSYIFTHQQSDIALFRYTRSQFLIGVTSQF